MKVRYLILFMLLGSTILFLQCNKDKIKSPYECIEHERLSTMLGQSIFLTTYPRNEMAYFNPNNSDEIIYRHGDGITPEFDLIKYNLKKKEKEVIYNGNFSNRPRWGKNGWILLNVNDSLGYNIYKIKDIGEDLTRLTTNGNCFYPEWDINSEKVIYQYAFTTPTKGILMNENGVVLDTLLCPSTSFSSWQHPELLATGSFVGLNITNPFECEVKWLFYTDGVAQSANGAEWLDQERVFWCHTTGIYITNIITKKTERIRETCNARCYQRPTYAADINKIIVEKLERIKKDSEAKGIIKLSLVMMNPDGSEEEEIELE